MDENIRRALPFGHETEAAGPIEPFHLAAHPRARRRDVVGGDWTDARNEQAAVWLVQSAMKTYAIDPKRIIITGYSMGGEGTWYIGSRHQDVFTGAIPVAAPVAGSTEWKVPIYVIHSQDDEIVSHASAKRHAEAIKSNGGKLEFKSISGLTHYDTPSYANHVGEGVKWLEEQWK
jgi:predicted esterase